MKVLWANEVDNIQRMLDSSKTLESIGEYYGVSRQRMYQVLTKFGLETPVRKRKNKLLDRDPKYYWTNKMLITKGFSSQEVEQLLDTLSIPDTCPILGLSLNYMGTGGVGYTRDENSPSIDKVDPSKGYTRDNIAIISWRANRIKNDGNEEEHRKIADFIRDY